MQANWAIVPAIRTNVPRIVRVPFTAGGSRPRGYCSLFDLLAIARQTRSMTLLVKASVFLIKRMSMNTMRFVSIGIWRTCRVFGNKNRFQMRRLNTASVLTFEASWTRVVGVVAKMIQSHSLRNRANEVFISPSMGQRLGSSEQSSVPFVVQCADPFKATIRQSSRTRFEPSQIIVQNPLSEQGIAMTLPTHVVHLAPTLDIGRFRTVGNTANHGSSIQGFTYVTRMAS